MATTAAGQHSSAGSRPGVRAGDGGPHGGCCRSAGVRIMISGPRGRRAAGGRLERQRRGVRTRGWRDRLITHMLPFMTSKKGRESAWYTQAHKHTRTFARTRANGSDIVEAGLRVLRDELHFLVQPFQILLAGRPKGSLVAEHGPCSALAEVEQGHAP
jgi:hypothetical protein